MGFRRITFHFDRPDILSKYKVRLEANKEKFPGMSCTLRYTREATEKYVCCKRNCTCEQMMMCPDSTTYNTA